MKRRLVYRYTCDFCKKSNCSASAITKHERACTNNPARACGVCKVTYDRQVPMDDLKAAFALDLAERTEADDYEFRCGVEHLAALTECPACMLAAIRQTPHEGVHVAFEFKPAMETYWQDFNSINV
jgi:hypothetical protein